jgi:hypothetical protein
MSSFTGSLSILGSLTATSTITAQTLVVQTITSSISSITGSTNFGSIAGNTHTFTGSMSVSGSGTFVSALSGTSATFGGLLTINIPTDNTTVGIFHAGGGTANRGLKISTFANVNDNAGVRLDAQTTAGGATLVLATAGTDRLTIASTGAATFSAATQDAIQTVIRMSGYNASSQLKALDFKLTAGTPLWTISTAAVGTDAGINIMPNGSAGLSLAYTGAATFSSSVTANSTISAYYGSITSGNTPATSGTTPVNPMLNLTNNRGIGMYFGGKYSGDYAQWIQVSDTGNLGVNYPLLLNPNGGNVGIGNSVSAVYPLVVKVATNRNWAISNSGTGFASFRAGDDGYFNFNRGEIDALPLVINSQSGGNVGIGAADSIVRLNVVGASATSSNFAFYVTNSTPSPMFFIRNDGYMSFGLEANSPYNIAQSGRTCILASNGSVGYLSSTRESKTNIANLNDISWLYQLNPVSFNYRKKDDENNYTNEAENEKWYGLIADEVEGVNEDLVFYKTKEDKTKELAGVEYNKLIAALVKGMQEQQAQIETLEARITELENK